MEAVSKVRTCANCGNYKSPGCTKPYFSYEACGGAWKPIHPEPTLNEMLNDPAEDVWDTVDVESKPEKKESIDSNMMAEEVVALHKTIKELRSQLADLNAHTKQVEKSNLDFVLEKDDLEKQISERDVRIKNLIDICKEVMQQRDRAIEDKNKLLDGPVKLQLAEKDDIIMGHEENIKIYKAELKWRDKEIERLAKEVENYRHRIIHNQI
jgi:uncharacterized protein (DUF3084 family)